MPGIVRYRFRAYARPRLRGRVMTKRIKTGKRFGRSLYPGRTPFLFLAPFLLVYAVLWLWPIVFSLFLSLNRWSGGGAPLRFVGLKNYIFLFGDKDFQASLLNTLYFCGGFLAVMLPLALFLALLLNIAFLRLKGFFRSVFFSPMVMSKVVVAMIFFLILDDRGGLLAFMFDKVGLVFPNLLASKRLVMPTIISLSLWRTTGVYMLFFLAGLQGISPEIYEAARMDGANNLQTFLYITLPQLRNAAIFIVTIALINSINIFDSPYLLTGGGPGNASMTLALNLFRQSFTHYRFGIGAGVSAVLLVIILIFTLFFLIITGAFKMEES